MSHLHSSLVAIDEMIYDITNGIMYEDSHIKFDYIHNGWRENAGVILMNYPNCENISVTLMHRCSWY